MAASIHKRPVNSVKDAVRSYHVRDAEVRSTDHSAASGVGRTNHAATQRAQTLPLYYLLGREPASDNMVQKELPQTRGVISQVVEGARSHSVERLVRGRKNGVRPAP